jgi:hypothetical protein
VRQSKEEIEALVKIKNLCERASKELYWVRLYPDAWPLREEINEALADLEKIKKREDKFR